MTALLRYYQLTKPGIIRGNVITAGAGFLLAAQGAVDLALLGATLTGLAAIIASACVCNNILDRSIDKFMERTRHRALVVGDITVRRAAVFSGLLGIVGTSLLLIYTNLLTTSLALFGFIMYIVVYGYTKRHTLHSTLVGSISGAVPPLIGYCSVTNQLDRSAGILAAILVLWQMAHFFAIAIYRHDDYQAASIPVMSVARGMRASKLQIVIYIGGFTLTAACLSLFGLSGRLYLVLIILLGSYWLIDSLRSYRSSSDIDWSRRVFKNSLVVITGWCLAITLDSFIH